MRGHGGTGHSRGGNIRGHSRGRQYRGRGGTAFRANAPKSHDEVDSTQFAGSVHDHSTLTYILERIDGQGYAAYKQLKGTYTWTEGIAFELFVEHVQSDPYAAPSRFRARLPISLAGFPSMVYDSKLRKIALCDYLNRRIVSLVKQSRLDASNGGQSYHGPKGGDFHIYEPEQNVLERSSCIIGQLDSGELFIEIRFTINLPAHGRSIDGRKANDLLIHKLPELVSQGLLWENQDHEKVIKHYKSVEIQEGLRNALDNRLVAFIGNGSILPRASGVDSRPLEDGAFPFKAPRGSLEVTLDTKVPDENGKGTIKVQGMGIPSGVTVITGGGFHGKTTLLEALELGVYNVIPGDGRELVVSESLGFKIRAEDGRNVVGTDISPFINNLPGGRSTSFFTSMDASGSTSMAANIQESLEIGATWLVIDEDTSATNLLVRDSKMQDLIRNEPISPLVSKVGVLYKERNVSTVIVIGGCGDYLNVADTVIGMESYQPHDWTGRARSIACSYPSTVEPASSYGNVGTRIPSLPNIHIGKPPMARGSDTIVVRDFHLPGSENADTIDISTLEQLVEKGQANTCAEILRYISKHPKRSMADWSRDLLSLIETRGLDALQGDGWIVGDLVYTRPLEMLATVNRFRGLKVERLVS